MLIESEGLTYSNLHLQPAFYMELFRKCAYIYTIAHIQPLDFSNRNYTQFYVLLNFGSIYSVSMCFAFRR